MELGIDLLNRIKDFYQNCVMKDGSKNGVEISKARQMLQNKNCNVSLDEFDEFLSVNPIERSLPKYLKQTEF